MERTVRNSVVCDNLMVEAGGGTVKEQFLCNNSFFEQLANEKKRDSIPAILVV